MSVPHQSVREGTQAADHINEMNEEKSCNGQETMPKFTFDPSQDGTIQEPINREMPIEELTASWLTKENNYDRNHGPIQHIDAARHKVRVDGLVNRELELSIADLQTMPQYKVACSLLCAGNRRHTMRTRIKEVEGVDWFDGAVMNCLWEGPRLLDVLKQAGIEDDQSDGKDYATSTSSIDRHVQFSCHATKVQDDEWYGGSIPLSRAIDPNMDVILALKMNNEPLDPRHGYPVRAIVPGVVGARSVKWLDRITISSEESANFYQRHDYKVLPPTATDKSSAEPYWPVVPAMLDMPINSCVASPQVGATVYLDDDNGANGTIPARGYAVPQGADGPITKVEVSGDEGATWTLAQLDPGPAELRSKWTWTLWRANVHMSRGTGRKIWCRATDQGGNTQAVERSEWNLRGVGYNGFESVWDITVL